MFRLRYLMNALMKLKKYRPVKVRLFIMKKILLIIIMLWGVSQAQTIGYFRYDTAQFYRVGGNGEVKFMNSTRGVTGGVLTNMGNGWGQWVTPAAAGFNTASNGLTAVGSNVKIGGTGIENTTINWGLFKFSQTWTSPEDATQTLLMQQNYTPASGDDAAIADFNITANMTGGSGGTNQFTVGIGGTANRGFILNAGNNSGEHKVLQVRQDSVSLVTYNGAFGPFTALAVSGTGVSSPNLSFPSLANATTQDRILGQTASSKQVGYITLGSGLSLASGVLSASAGATPNLQQVLTAGSTLTGNNTINGGGNDLSFTNNNSYQVLSGSGSTTASLYLDAGGNAAELSTSRVGANSGISVKSDSIRITPPLGALIIDTLNYSANADDSMVVWRKSTGYVGMRAIPTGGGSPALAATYIGYGSGANVLTGEADYSFATTDNIATLNNGAFSFTGSQTFGAAGAGSIYKNSTTGLTFRAVSGGAYDFAITGVSGNGILGNEAGTDNMGTSGKWGAGLLGSSLSAWMHIAAGTSILPSMKIATGTLLSTAAAGAFEYNNSFYATKASGLRFALEGTIADFYTDVNNSGTGETDIYSYTTPASTLAADGEKVFFSYSLNLTDITATATIKCYFAGTEIANTGALTVSATGAVIVSGWIVRTSSTTARASVNISSPTASTAVYTAQTDLTGLTLSGTNILKITAQAGGGTGGNNDIVGKSGTVSWRGVAAN